MDIQYFHHYNKLVRRDLVVPLTCECGTVYARRADEEGEPYFDCYGCNSQTRPSQKFYDEIRAVVSAVFN